AISDQLVDTHRGSTTINGGSSDNDEKPWQVKPDGLSPSPPVTTVTHEAKWPSTERIVLLSNVSNGVGMLCHLPRVGLLAAGRLECWRPVRMARIEPSPMAVPLFRCGVPFATMAVASTRRQNSVTTSVSSATTLSVWPEPKASM